MDKNFMRDFAKMPPIERPLSKVTAFLAGVLFSAIVFLPLAIAFWILVLSAALTEADIRAAKALVVGISRMDAACLEWRETDGKYYCVRR